MNPRQDGGLIGWLGGAVLLAALLAAVMAQQRMDANATGSARAEAVARLQALVEAQMDRELGIRGELIAGNQAVVAYMTQALGSALPGERVDASSVVDLLEERRTQLRLSLAAVVAPDGALLASTDPSLRDHDFAADPVFAGARDTQATQTGLWVERGRLVHVAMLPLARYGSGDATLVVGEAIDEAFLAMLARPAGTPLALQRTDASGPVVVASSQPLPPDAVAAAIARGAAAPALFGNPDVRLVALDAGDARSGLLRTHLPLLAFALLATLAVIALLVAYRRNVVAPLHALESLMRRAAETGDVHLRAMEAGAGPVRSIAAACNALLLRLRGTPT